MNYEKFYKKYWEKEFEKRNKVNYYQRLYNVHKHKLVLNHSNKIIDIGGGNGQFLQYLGIKKAHVLDISESGLACAKKLGYITIKADLQKRFPLAENSFDTAYCFEVLEHLEYPAKTLTEINNILKKNGVLFIGQPNTPADGIHHVRRIYVKELIDDLHKTGFKIDFIRYVPAFNKWQRNFHAVLNAKSAFQKIIFLLAHILTFIPFRIKLFLAYKFPNRFALLYIIKSSKI